MKHPPVFENAGQSPVTSRNLIAVKSVQILIFCVIACCYCNSGFAQESAKLPEAGRRLQEAYRKSIEAAIKPTRDRYVADLKKLQQQAMKAGSIGDALAFQYEIEDVLVGHMFGDWSSVEGRVNIRADHTAVWENGSNTATWEIRGNEMILKWKQGGGIVFVYSISKSGDVLRGKRIDPNGGSEQITATRIRR